MKILEWVRLDGLVHIETCTIIAVVFGLLLPWWVAFLAAFAVGVAKEVLDIWFGSANWHDLICDLAGALFGMIIVLVS